MECDKILDKIMGCLFGGALGDSLGYPVEFKKVTNKNTFLSEKPNIRHFSDDTQMTLFTAEGIIASENEEDTINNILTAYKYWYGTQDILQNYKYSYDSMLFDDERLHHRRAPGNTCLNSLRRINVNNNSIGCGGVMRVAPIGIVFNPDKSYRLGCKAAFLTHHGEMGYIPAGIFAAIISNIMDGNNIEKSCENAIKLANNKKIEEKYSQILSLVSSSEDDISCIKQIGEGWVGDEALYIAMFCALRHSKYDEEQNTKNFYDALVSSVTHDGDSDSTGAICGNILGAYYGFTNFPISKKNIECSDIIDDLSQKLLQKRNHFSFDLAS